MLLTSLAILSLSIWCVLLAARGGFWQVQRQFAPRCVGEGGEHSVAVIVPARDEALHIGETVTSLINQKYSGPFHIFLVDDNSTDGTPQVAWNAASSMGQERMLTLLQGQPLAAGWTGKLWALSQGIAEASRYSPDYFLFTDADVVHGPNSLHQLVSLSQSGHYDLVSFMVKLRCETLAEKVLIPAFVFFFFLLYPPAWTSSQRRQTAGAAGGCVLIRPERLEKVGGVASIGNQVIDDCALARAVKRSGGRIWLGLTNDRFSLRSYGSFGEVGSMISRTAFNQLHHSSLLLASTLAGLLVVYVAPIALLFSGDARLVLAGAAAWTMMSIAYDPMVRFYGRSTAWSLTLPLAALFYLAATFHSAIQYWSGRGGRWKGRAQDA